MKKSKKKIVLLLITAIFLYCVFVNLDLTELFKVIQKFNIIYLIPLVISIIVSLSFRGLVFKNLLYNAVNPPLFELSHLCITSAAMNIVLPARAGDIFRAFYIGHKYNTDKIKILGTVLFERIFDIIVIFSFLLSGICIYHRNQLAIHLCVAAGICMLIGFGFIIYAYKYNKTDSICQFILKKTSNIPFSDIIEKIILFINHSCNSFFKGFEVIKSPKHIILAVISSYSVWFFEGLNFYIVMQGFGTDIHWSVVLFIISFIALACMIPSASIYIGPYQMAIISAFGLYNVNKETALAISIIDQSVVAITTSIIGIIFFIKNNISYKEIKTVQNLTKE